MAKQSKGRELIEPRPPFPPVELYTSLRKAMKDAIEGDRHMLIVIYGDMGYGKSSLALWIMYEVYRDWNAALQYLVFKPDEFIRLIHGAAEEGKRIPAILWDDAGVWLNRWTIDYTDPAIKRLFSDYALIRPYLAILIMTTPRKEWLPRAIQRMIDKEIFVPARGIAGFWDKKEFPRIMGSEESYKRMYFGERIRWSKLPPEIWVGYQELRHQYARGRLKELKQTWSRKVEEEPPPADLESLEL